MAKTQSGHTWETAVSVRWVLTQDGQVTIATGTGPTCKELAAPTKVHGVGGTVRMVATTVRTIYNDASMCTSDLNRCFCKSAGLSSRMIKFVPEGPGEEAPKRMHIVHDLADRQENQQQSSSSKGDKDQEGKRSRESGAPASSSSSQRPRDE